MKPLRATRTAGVLKDLLDVLYWAIVILAPVYAALVAYGYARGGRPGVALVADVWFEPSPGAGRWTAPAPGRPSWSTASAGSASSGCPGPS